MAIYQPGETFTHYVTIRDRDNVKVDPTSIKITINDPCGSSQISSQNMTKSTTGVYYYYWKHLPSTATYGRYTVEVTATAATSEIGIYKDEFYVMPWNIQKDVRQKTGASETKDINDDDLSDLCWTAYLEALRDVYRHHYKEVPKGDPTDGAGFDGSNTDFQTHFYPIADINGDGTILGNNSSCATDIDCWWIDSNGRRRQAVIEVGNHLNGEISIFQGDGSTAIPSNHEGVYINYWSQDYSFDETDFRNAVAFLAADYLEIRMKESDRTTIADLTTNKAITEELGRGRFNRKYRQLLNKVRKPMVAGVN